MNRYEAFIGSSWRDSGMANPFVARLRDESVPELRGVLELAGSPDLPLDAPEPLRLRLKGSEFTHRDIAVWCIL